MTTVPICTYVTDTEIAYWLHASKRFLEHTSENASSKSQVVGHELRLFLSYVNSRGTIVAMQFR